MFFLDYDGTILYVIDFIYGLLVICLNRLVRTIVLVIGLW